MMQKAILEGNSGEQCNRTREQARACPKYSPQSPNGCWALTAHSFSPRIQCHCNHTTCYCNIRWIRPTKLGSALHHLLVTSLSHSPNDRDWPLTNNCLCKYPFQLSKLYMNLEKAKCPAFLILKGSLTENWKVYCNISVTKTSNLTEEYVEPSSPHVSHRLKASGDLVIFWREHKGDNKSVKKRSHTILKREVLSQEKSHLRRIRLHYKTA